MRKKVMISSKKKERERKQFEERQKENMKINPILI